MADATVTRKDRFLSLWIAFMALLLAAADTHAGEVAWWQAERNANDKVGGANGILEGVSFAPGKAGFAFRLSGSTASVRVPDTPSLDITNRWTLAAWVYTTSLSGHKGGAQGVVSKVGGRGGNYGYQLAIVDRSGEVLLQFNQSGEGWPGYSLRAGKIPLDTWTHITGSFDNNTMAIYVNGILAGSKIVGPKSVANSSSSFRIGLDDNGNVDFSGLIDEVRVYNHALSADEVRSLSSAEVAVQNPAAQTYSQWTSITPDPRQFIGQPGKALPLAVRGYPTFEAGDYMVYVGPSNPSGLAISRWSTFGPFTLKGHDKVGATMTAQSKLTMEPNSAQLLQYSDPGPTHAMIYVRNSDPSSWQSICVLPVGWDARARCFGGSNNVRYVAEGSSGDTVDQRLFDNRNDGEVFNGPTQSTAFTLSARSQITTVTTYHWNNGKGTPAPGTIALRNSAGKVFGPWQAIGQPGSGGVPNAYWVVRPSLELPAGSYAVIDSNPATWAQNSGSGGAGMSWVEGYPR